MWFLQKYFGLKLYDHEFSLCSLLLLLALFVSDYSHNESRYSVGPNFFNLKKAFDSILRQIL